MVKGFTRGKGDSRKFIPTRRITRGLSRKQMEHEVEAPMSAGNEMLVRKKFSLAEFRKNEAKNFHTENAVALVEQYGTPEEKKEIHEIQDRHDKSEHGISHEDYQRRYQLHRKYYPKLLADEKENKK